MERLRGNLGSLCHLQYLHPLQWPRRLLQIVVKTLQLIAATEGAVKTIYSFSYKYGTKPEADMVIDCRGMSNPHHVLSLKMLDGRSQAVQDFVFGDRRARTSMTYVTSRLTSKTGVTNSVAFGCYGGKHRSVALAERVADQLRAKGVPVEVKHLALAVDSVDK